MNLRQNEIILFQGDSITDGNRGRNLDPNHVMGHGYQFIVGAKLHVDNIDKNIQTFNRGISGNRISDLYGRWLEDCINLKPTMLSILIGVNDILHAFEENSGSSPERVVTFMNSVALLQWQRFCFQHHMTISKNHYIFL